MTEKLSGKYNEACIKLFEFIKMLYSDDAEFKKVIMHFSDGNYNGKSNTHVALNKYLNALNIFGVKVKKIQHKYKIQSSLYQMSFDIGDIKSVEKIKEAKSILPKGKYKNNLDKFINNIEIRYNEKAKELQQKVINSGDFGFLNMEIVAQIKTCEKYCQDKQKLEIIYSNNDDNINLLCTPIEVIYLKRKASLKVSGSNGNRIYDIPLENIKTIKQLPVAGNPLSMPTTIVYRIKNRLAKNYKLRDWEKVENIEDNGSLVIVNKSEDLNLLLKRLMKYNTECEIISPKFIKEEMINLINKTLSNYQ